MSIKLMEQFIAQTNFLELYKSYSSPVEAIGELSNSPVQLIFLDVEMPELSGMDLLKSIPPRIQVVLTTSKKKYAIEAFEYEVTDYLLKPVTYSRFLKAAAKAKSVIEQAGSQSRNVDPKSLYVKDDNIWVNIAFADISWIEALGDYVTIHAKEKNYTVLTTMKAVEEKLPTNKFLRIHRSYIVNIDQISNLDGNMLVVNKKLLPIGKSYKKVLMDKLNII